MVFLPLALALPVVVAFFNLYIYGTSVRQAEQSHLFEVGRLAAGVATELARATAPPTAARLQALVPTGAAVAVFDRHGRLLAQTATPIWVSLTSLPIAGIAEQPQEFGPSALDAPVVSAVAPFETRGQQRILQIDLPADRLAAQIGALERTVFVNIAALSSLALLFLLFLRRLLAPYRSLLEHARRIDAQADPTGDEVDFLVDTFERAVRALEGGQGDEPDDIAVLERALARSLESGLLLLDRAGNVLVLNQLGADILAVSPPPPGTHISAFLGHLDELLEALREAVEMGHSVRRQEFSLEVGSAHRFIGLTLHPLRRDDQEVRGFLVLFTDLTESQARDQDAQVAKSLRQLGELAAGVAHELRNGLATLKGYLTLVENPGDDETVRDYIGEMRTETEHLERVVNDFLSFARPESIAIESVDLLEVVNRAAQDPSTATFPVEVTSAGPIPSLRGDSLLLERAIKNLLHNAMQAQTDAGCGDPIRVELVAEGELVRLTIDDAGVGVPADLGDSVFQPFVSGRAEGVGLGLALAHRIAELHAGSLSLDNRREGGARATLQLPVRNVTFGNVPDSGDARRDRADSS